MVRWMAIRVEVPMDLLPQLLFVLLAMGSRMVRGRDRQKEGAKGVGDDLHSRNNVRR